MHTQSHNKEVFHSIKYSKDKSKEMAKIKITQVRSKIGRHKRQKRTLEALGLKRMGIVVEHEATPQIIGMVNKVLHLVKVEGDLTVEKKPVEKKEKKVATTTSKKVSKPETKTEVKAKKAEPKKDTSKPKAEVSKPEKKEAKETKEKKEVKAKASPKAKPAEAKAEKKETKKKEDK